MLTSDLNKQIQLLVDHLRKQPEASVSLTDIAGVTEVLIATMSAYFKAIDTAIYRECRALSEYIDNARKEIASLEPGDLESSRIPRAGLELDAIVQHTEEATNTIMEAAEEIMGADSSDTDAYVQTTQDAVMRIFEACSFQDITGQRISKVVQTLTHIETRVLDLRDLMGITEDEVRAAQTERTDTAPEKTDDEKLLQGPALDGEGIGQGEVDALLGGKSAPASEKSPQQPSEPAPQPKPTAPAPEAEQQPASKAKPAPKPDPAPAPPPPPKPVDPAELDAMFDEDFDFEAPAPKEEPPEKPAEKPAAKADDAGKDDKKSEKKDDKKADAADDLPAGGEVSQDDIDALFG